MLKAEGVWGSKWNPEVFPTLSKGLSRTKNELGRNEDFVELYQQLQDMFSNSAVTPDSGNVSKSTTGQDSPLRDRIFLLKRCAALAAALYSRLNSQYFVSSSFSLSPLGGFSYFRAGFLCLKFFVCSKMEIKIQLFHCKSFPV